MSQVANTTVQLQRLIETAARKHGVPEDKIGPVAADAVGFIVQIYGGRRPYIPSQQHARNQRNEAIVRAITAGAKPSRIARQYELPIGTVLRIVSAALRATVGPALRGKG